MAEKQFAIRLSAKGTAEVRAALKGMGSDGAAALRQIDQASAKTTPGLKAVDAASKSLRSQFDQLAGRIPVVGGALQALGPLGLGIAAGFAAIGVGANALGNSVRTAVDKLGALKDAAEQLQTDTDTLQAIRWEGVLRGLTNEDVDGLLTTLQANSARNTEGFGKMRAALEKVNPELARQLALATNLQERMDILAKGVQGATTETEKLNVVNAAFGNSGSKMLGILDEGGASMDTFAARAKAAGVVIEQELIDKMDRLGDSMDKQASRAEAAGMRIAAAAAPAVDFAVTSAADLATGLASLGDFFAPLEKQSTAYINSELAKMREFRVKRREEWQLIASEPLSADRYMALMEAELAKREAADGTKAKARADKARADLEALLESQKALDDEAAKARAAARKAAATAEAEAAKQAAEAQRAALAIEKEAIALRQELGDWTGVYAAKQAELNALVGQYGITQEMVNVALAKFQSGLDGSAAFAAKTASALDSIKTPAERAADELAEYAAEAVRLGQSTLPEVIAAIRAKTAALNDLTAAEEAAAFALSPLGVQLQANADAMKASTGAYRDAKDANFELAFSLNTMEGIYRGQIRTLGDLKNVALDTFYRIAVGAIEAAAKVKGANLGDIFSAIASAFGFGGSAPSASKGTNIFSSYQALGDAMAAGVHHDGRVIGDPRAPMRLVPKAVFHNAPRHHIGLEPDEMPIIAQKGERMFSRMDNARIVRAVEGGVGGGGNVNIRIVDETGAKFETRETRSADGGRDIEIRVRSAAARGAASGDLDAVMSQRYGVTRRVK